MANQDHPEYLPISPSTIESWHEYFGRFNEVIYPQIFKPFGIDMETAHMLWALNDVRESIAAALGPLPDDDEDEDKPEWLR